MPSNKVRTRFAPSPTGYMHVGNLRTALYTYLMAKHEDGTFILRIEDTDQGRYVEGAVDVIYNTLRETGLLWDEGPDIGGPVGPYVQSERMGMFKQYAEQLVAEGKAYYCFCTEERLEALHAEQRAAGEMTHYDGCCRELPKEEVEKRLAAGEPYVIRQKIPREGVTGFDEVFYAPHSRHTGICREDVDNCAALRILAESDAAGPFLMSTENGRQIFVTGHPEYDKYTLDAEYKRDVAKGLPIHVPVNYYPDDDPAKPPLFRWRAHAHLLYENWLNYYVYQNTPYDLGDIQRVKHEK